MDKIYFFLFQLFSVAGFAQWVSTNGPYGGNVYAFAEYQNKIFACADVGLYESNDNGETWHINSTGYHNLVFVHKQSIYKYGLGGVMVSEDGGHTWKNKSSGLYFGDFKNGAMHYAFASLGDTVLFGYNGGLFLSSGGDTSWTNVINQKVTALAGSGNAVMYCTNEEGDGFAFLSNDRGLTWKTINLDSLWNESGIEINALDIKGDTILMGNAISINKGQTWMISPVTSYFTRCFTHVTQCSRVPRMEFIIQLRCLVTGYLMAKDSEIELFVRQLL